MPEIQSSCLTRDVHGSAFGRIVRSARMLTAGLGVWLLTDCACAQQPRIELDVPAQPLDQALKAFGAATGSQVFYETGLTVGRMSKKVQGVYEREAALQVLLRESELAARTIAADTFTIVPKNTLSPVLRQAK